jgi:hypothetical protein
MICCWCGHRFFHMLQFLSWCDDVCSRECAAKVDAAADTAADERYV